MYQNISLSTTYETSHFTFYHVSPVSSLSSSISFSRLTFHSFTISRFHSTGTSSRDFQQLPRRAGAIEPEPSPSQPPTMVSPQPQPQPVPHAQPAPSHPCQPTPMQWDYSQGVWQPFSVFPPVTQPGHVPPGPAQPSQNPASPLLGRHHYQGRAGTREEHGIQQSLTPNVSMYH